jgi:hypothetical protein
LEAHRAALLPLDLALLFYLPYRDLQLWLKSRL